MAQRTARAVVAARHLSLFADFGVFLRASVKPRNNRFPKTRKDLRRLVHVLRAIGEGNEATGTQTGGFRLPLDQKAQNIRRDIHLLTPTWTFVETAVGDATVIGLATNRAQCISGLWSRHHAIEPPV
jgi:hypothetical protein